MKIMYRTIVVAVAGLVLAACGEGFSGVPHDGPVREELSLAGEWAFRLDPESVGLERGWATNSFDDVIALPGTTDLAKKGDGKVGGNVTERIHPQLVGADMARQLTMHLTRRFPFVGTAWYRREVDFPSRWAGRRVTLSFERTKILTLFVDGEKVGTRHSLVAAQEFELPERFATGRHVLTLAVDNRIDRLPVSGHQVSDDTQTNWNGVIGELKAVATDKVAIGRVRVTPHVADRTADVEVTLVNRLETAADGEVTVTGGKEPATATFAAARSGASVRLRVAFAKDAAAWDEFDPVLQNLRVTLRSGGFSDAADVRFGFCEFRTKGTQFTVNGKPVFLRGRHDACVWPRTGCPPMDKDAWLGYFRTLKAWGLNHVRCHSWVPPRAAFEAADETGFYLQPEFGRFGGDFTSDEMQRLYALAEAERVSDACGNSPSFVMWTYSNEPLGHSGALAELVAAIRAYDPRRLYAQASNGDYNAPHPNPGDDFWSTFRSCPGAEGNVRGSYANCDLPLGRVQTGPADTLGDFSSAVPHAQVPLIGHEVGQYESYPDFREIAKYDGALRAVSFEIFSNRLEKAGMADQADDFFRASAALQAINYREDIEEALRTPGFGGFQLLDLQDFPGQGTALVGLLNAFMEPKGVVTADEWRQWCAPTVLLARFPSYVYRAGEAFRAKVECAHYGREDEIAAEVVWRVLGSDGRELGSGELPLRAVRGRVAAAERELTFGMPQVAQADKLTLSLALRGRAEHTAYPLWVYPKADAAEAPEVTVVRDLASGERLMKEGKRVLCILDKTAFPTNSVEGWFASDFWCYPMFRHVCEFLGKKPAPGTLGLLVRKDHPALAGFPTDFHSDYQWFDIVQNSVSVILDDLPAGCRPIVQTIDNTARNHRLGLVYERSEGEGWLVVCGADLISLKGHPAADQLYRSLLSYVADGHPFREPGYDTLIAHRGESFDAPENTLPAYRMAVERGFGFECDIYLSTDGRCYTFHDGALTRTTDGANTNRCCDVDWKTVEKLNVAGWGMWKGSKYDPTRPALLEEVLALARPGRKIYVEIKTGPEIVPFVKKAMEQEPRATPETVLFISFNAESCRALKRDLPDYKVYLLDGGRPWNCNPETKKWEPGLPYASEELIARVRACGADGIDLCFIPEVHACAFVKAFHDAGLEFHVWTIDDPAVAAEAFRRGAETVTTNRAKYILDSLGFTRDE